MAESALSLVERLRAALDRAEEIARAATPGPWHAGNATELGAADVYAGREAVTSAYAEPCCSYEDAVHMAANGPDVVLRTVAAHRKILDLLPAVAELEERDEREHGPLDVKPSAELLAAVASIYFPEAPDA